MKRQNAMRMSCALLMMATGLTSTAMAQAASTSTRRYQSGSWAEVLRVDADHGHAFVNPHLLELSGDVLLVYDIGAKHVVAFSRDGRRLWKVGDDSSGVPIDSVMGLIGDGKGGGFVLDRMGRRLIIVSRGGKERERRELRPSVSRLARTTRGKLLAAEFFGGTVMTMERWSRQTGPTGVFIPTRQQLSDRVIIRFVSNPVFTSWDRVVLQGFLDATEVRVLSASGAEQSRFELLDRQVAGGVVLPTIKPTVGTRLENEPSPRVLRAFTVDRDTLYVVDDRLNAVRPSIDLYGLPRGEYIVTRELPRAVKQARVDGEFLITLIDGPTPGIVIWRWTSGAGDD
ncbi:MAG: hypothetical protein IT353_05135 [Gemmatimonadaceae bacterium]|nr:hypothetical protein [Gemmatimonadaceae bacterium]